MKNLWTGLALMSAVGSVAALGAMTGGCTGTTTTVVVADAGINCGAGSIECGGSCTAVARDSENCGSCGKKCASGEVCSAGACASACGSGTTKCGNECVDTKTDDRNCGACGTKCSGIEVCNAGACAPGCSQGQMKCGSSCVDTQTDRTNCGGCGTVCKDGETCSAGKCDVSCQSGLTKCSTSVSDGGVSDASVSDGGLGPTYCANLVSDNANCGACGKVCKSNEACVASACVFKGCSDPNDVLFQGKCYNLDGVNGACVAGYTMGSNANLTAILAANPNAWQGKNYKSTVSGNCCVRTVDPTENFGMTGTYCGVAGPFGAGTPVAGGSGCTNATNQFAKQLTLCVSQ